MVGKVWLFVLVAFILAGTVSSKQVSGIGSRSLWPSFVGNSFPRGHGNEQRLPNHSVGTPVYKVTPRQPALIGQENLSDLSGNLTNSPDNEWYSKTPSNIRLYPNNLPQERHQDAVVKKVLQIKKPFSKMLFDHVLSSPIRDEVIKTMFVKGMALGTLRSSSYVDYMIQDIVYLTNAARAYNDAAQMMQEQGNYEFALFYRKQAHKFDLYYKDALSSWRLENVDNVKTGTAIELYMGYHKALIKTNPRFLPIAMLPCSMLYPWVVRQFIGTVDKQNPYYEDWFVKNSREDDNPSSTELFVDTKFTPQDEELSVGIFCEGMMNELNFFREAGGEKLLTLEEVCKNRFREK